MTIVRASDGLTTIELQSLSIDEASILRIQGYRDIEAVRRAIKRAASSAARLTEELATPRIYFRTFNVIQCQGETLSLEGGAAFENEAFGRFLAGAEQIVVFVLTMGPALDEAVIESISSDRLLDALFLEAAGWLGIEAATKFLSTHLRELAGRQGQRLSLRLGPGYSYKLNGKQVHWPLEQQQTLFRLFANDPIDVQLLESSAMLPKLSRSGLFGYLPSR